MSKVIVTLYLRKTGMADRRIDQEVYDVHDELTAAGQAVESLSDWLVTGWMLRRVACVSGLPDYQADAEVDG